MDLTTLSQTANTKALILLARTYDRNALTILTKKKYSHTKLAVEYEDSSRISKGETMKTVI